MGILKRTSRSAGFTIVELLIVIVVIAVLASVALVAYRGVQSRTRDSERIAKVQAIAKALELYFIDNGRYPPIQDGSGSESTCGSQTENWGHCDRMKTLADALAPYTKLVPEAMSSTAPNAVGANYYYNSAGNDQYQHYGLRVLLEGNGGADDGGYSTNAYEVGQNPRYCTQTYTGSGQSWSWSSSNTRCQGGN